MEEVPPKMQLLDSVWATRRKSKIGTGEICKYKARLNAHWGQQEHDVTYHETYASLLKKINPHTIHHQRMSLPATRFCIGTSTGQIGWRSIHEITQRF